jgi:hypothetical protein
MKRTIRTRLAHAGVSATATSPEPPVTGPFDDDDNETIDQKAP